MCYTITKGNYQRFFTAYVTFSINFNVGSLGGTTIAWCYHSHSVPYAGLRVLKVADLNLVDNVVHITPQ